MRTDSSEYVDVPQMASRLPAFDDAAQMLDEDIPVPATVIDGFLRRGEKCVIGGASKSFKSWLALDLAIAVAHGVPWLGRAVTSGRVLVANLELPKWCLASRLLAIARA